MADENSKDEEKQESCELYLKAFWAVLRRNFFPIIKVPEYSITRTAEFGLRLTDSFLNLNDVGGLETFKEVLLEATI